MYEKQLDRWNRRRDDEWKITITFWIGAIVSTGFLFENKLPLEQWHLGIIFIIWIIYVFVWLRGVWTANAKDKKWACVYKSQIDIAIGIKPIKCLEYTDPNPCDFFKDWSMIFQAIITAVILLLYWYTLYKLPVP